MLDPQRARREKLRRKGRLLEEFSLEAFLSRAYFVLKAGNGEITGVSKTFSTKTAMENAISSVMRNAPVAEISTTAN